MNAQPSVNSGEPTPPVIPTQPPKTKSYRKALRGISILAFVCLAGFLIKGSADFKANREKVQVIEKLEALGTNDVEMAKSLCTADGLKLWKAMEGAFPSRQRGFEISGFKNSGEVSDVALTRNTIDGVVKVHVRLVHIGTNWKYEDLFVEEAQGREIGLWCSFMTEHPVLSAAKIFSPEIKAAYGEAKTAAKEAVGTVRDVATIVAAFK